MSEGVDTYHLCCVQLTLKEQGACVEALTDQQDWEDNVAARWLTPPGVVQAHLHQFASKPRQAT